MIDQNKSSFLFSRILFLFGIVALGVSLVRCDKFEKPENKTQISEHGSNKSVDDDHQFNGQNCMNCHYSEGRGEGWFTLAGSVLGNNNQAVVHLYDDIAPDPFMNIEVDAVGNFYTTDPIDFSNGVNVSIEDDSGVIHYMGDKIYTGQCNLCHGITTPKLSY